jgi:hypothetical protein
MRSTRAPEQSIREAAARAGGPHRARRTAAAIAPAADPGEGFGWTLLARHGLRPLGFTGRLLFEAGNRATAAPIWSEIAVFETGDTRFVGQIRHGSAPPGAFAYADAFVCQDAQAVPAAFACHRPLALLPLELLEPGWGAGIWPLRPGHMQAGHMQSQWRALLAAVFGRAGVPIDT